MGRKISRAKHLLRNNGGQTMAEYAVVLAVLAGGAALLLAELGDRVVSFVNYVTGLLS